jgi:hypothetical protein
MRFVETIPGLGRGEDKGEWQRGWIQLWYIIRTLVNATMYSQYNDIKKIGWITINNYYLLSSLYIISNLHNAYES